MPNVFSPTSLARWASCSPGNDLRSAARPAVDHDDDRYGCGYSARPYRHGFGFTEGILFEEHIAVLQKLTGRGHGLLIEAAGVIPQVEDDAGHPFFLNRR